MQSINTICAFLSCYAKGNRKQYNTGERNRKPSKIALSYPQSTLTPLISKPRPQNLTKIESLNNVLEEVKKSIHQGIFIDPQIFSSLLETCYKLKALEQGKTIHSFIPTSLLTKNSVISSKLVRLYASLGSIEDAHEVFDRMSDRGSSAFPWNALISGYCQMGSYEDALALYFQMEEEGVPPDEYTFPRVLNACAGVGSLEVGRGVHRDSVRLGFVHNSFVLNALIDMYAKCGDITKSNRVFDSMTTKDAISWNSIISGYLRCKLPLKAMMIFRQMIAVDAELIDSVAVSSILACSSSTLEFGEELHCWSLKRDMLNNTSIANALIAMYSNWGKLERARQVFDDMRDRDLVAWNAIMKAHRRTGEVLRYFEEMEREGCAPDKITFVSVLSACAHQGLMREGERMLLIMRHKYKMKPSVEHYACVVNMYGRAGFVERAYEVASNMEFQGGATIWGALLYSSYLHNNLRIGEIAARKMFDLEPRNKLNFDMMIHIYAESRCFEDVNKLQAMICQRGL